MGRIPCRCDGVGMLEMAVDFAILAKAFEVAEEERLVLHDWPTQRAAVLIALERRLARGRA